MARAQITNASLGYSCGQQPPYGYDRMVIDEQGQHKQRVKNGEKYAKPRSWRVVWTPSDEQDKVDTARWLFKTYATMDIGYRALADQLNQRGVPGPTHGKWYDSTVRALLENEAYIGTFVWNKRRHGKYHRVVNGEIIERDRSEVHLMPCGKPNARRNPPELWTRVENVHPPLVDRELFNRVQAKIAKRKRSSGCSYQTHTKRKDRAEYLLTGLLFCAHCGRKMHGTVCTRHKGGKTYRYQKYICSSNTRGDRSCGHHAIRQEVIVRAILEKIRADLLRGDLERLKKHLRKRLQKQRQNKPDKRRLNRLQKRLGELDKQIDQGAERVLTAPEGLLDILTSKLQQFKEERAHVDAELRAARQSAAPVDVESEVDRVASKAWSLLAELEAAEPAKLREILRQAVDRVELSFTARQQGKRNRYEATGGRVLFRELSGFASRGERRCAEPDNSIEVLLTAVDLAAA